MNGTKYYLALIWNSRFHPQSRAETPQLCSTRSLTSTPKRSPGCARNFKENVNGGKCKMRVDKFIAILLSKANHSSKSRGEGSTPIRCLLKHSRKYCDTLVSYEKGFPQIQLYRQLIMSLGANHDPDCPLLPCQRAKNTGRLGNAACLAYLTLSPHSFIPFPRSVYGHSSIPDILGHQ